MSTGEQVPPKFRGCTHGQALHQHLLLPTTCLLYVLPNIRIVSTTNLFRAMNHSCCPQTAAICRNVDIRAASKNTGLDCPSVRFCSDWCEKQVKKRKHQASGLEMNKLRHLPSTAAPAAKVTFFESSFVTVTAQ